MLCFLENREDCGPGNVGRGAGEALEVYTLEPEVLTRASWSGVQGV